MPIGFADSLKNSTLYAESWCAAHLEIKRVLRSNDSSFERSYTYDHMSPIQQALTGRAARGQAEDNEFPDPYKQNFSYDAFSNMTLRTNRFWNHDADGLPANYANHRNLAWTYDEAGSITTIEIYRCCKSFDSAGDKGS